MWRKLVSCLFMAALAAFSATATAATAPAEIRIGTLYASSGPFAALGMPDYMGLKIWAAQENAQGGVMVKPFGKRIPVKLIAYDDQSDTATAATLYNQLITQDKVDILVADGGSVLTSMAVPIAREHKMLLIDQSGTGGGFFTSGNPYIVLTSTPLSTVWPQDVAKFLTEEGQKLGIKRLAIIYATNEFTGTQAKTFRQMIKDSKAPLDIVYDQGVPTNTSNYTVLINDINAHKPDAVVQLGYPDNDAAFLRNLEASGMHFKWLFAMYPGLEFDDLMKTVGASGMQYVYTYAPPSVMENKVNSGMTLPEFKAAWDKAYPDTKVAFGFNSTAGYTTGQVIQNALAATDSMSQDDLRKAIFGLSGKLKTLGGAFELNKEGAQIGEVMPLAQLVPDGKGKLKFAVVYPPSQANAKPLYPAPEN
ncbi:MAG: amino acid ABC transporter substrate-binding protein [Burkholderiaceae bacterium]|nr:MAG: amino acid ABC transporter substrate-binding protein [Burkholderiaceae bacterium]